MGRSAALASSARLQATGRAEKDFQKESEPEFKPPSPTESTGQKTIGKYSELFAAAVGNVEWLRFCLNRDHWEIMRDDKGFTAIHFAAQRGKLVCMQVLVEEYKFPVDLLTSNRQTPLHLVIHKDNKTMTLPCIHYLLEKGARVNTQTRNGSTPLHLAAREGLLSCVKVLVQRGANVHARDTTGCKPIDYCKIWNHRACARFLKDAMWKQDKKDFSCEMGKLKSLMDKLALMEHNYLTEYQKERKILRKANFKKWLHCKQLHQHQSPVSDISQEANAQPWPFAHSKMPESQISKSFHPSVEAQLQNLIQLPVPPKPTFKQPTISRPKLWNLSNNPATFPTTEISCPQGIRLGVHPDRVQEHDFCSFLKVTRNRHGGAQLHTVDGHRVVPVPQLPFKVMLHMLYPGAQPYRMKVPQGLYPISILDVSQKRYLGNDTFWTDALAMNLRETFDEAFLAALRAHKALTALPSSRPPK